MPFRGALVYLEIVEVLSRSLDSYGVFMESTCTFSALSRSAAFRALGLVLYRMDTMQLLDITNHRFFAGGTQSAKPFPWDYAWIFFLTC